VADLRAAGTLDFLLTDPSPNAVAVAKAAGFQPLGELRRHVLPLHTLYLAPSAVWGRVPRLVTTSVARASAVDRATADALASGCYDGGGFRAQRSIAAYAAHDIGETTHEARYVAIRVGGTPADAPADALAVLMRRPGSRASVLADLVWRESTIRPVWALHAAARAARELGAPRLSCSTLDGSAFGRELRTAGFLPRELHQPLFLLALRPTLALPPAESWLLTVMDGSSW
jgi:hypothetical protein